jgi:hypothetical protein
MDSAAGPAEYTKIIDNTFINYAICRNEKIFQKPIDISLEV